MNISSKAEEALAVVIRNGFTTNLSGDVIAGEPTVAVSVNDCGNLVVSANPGRELVVTVRTGETEETVDVPAIVVTCLSADEDIDARGNYSCEVEAAVKFPADSSKDDPWAVDVLRGIGDGVRRILGHWMFSELMTSAVPDFGCMGIEDKSTSRETDGRVRTQRHRMRLYCCGTTI